MSDLFKLHPYAECFPPMDANAFAELCESIRVHGLREPIVLLDGMILDGANRYKACQKVMPGAARFWDFRKDLNSKLTPAEYVWERNAVRRQLTPDQRIAAAEAIERETNKIKDAVKAEASQKMAAAKVGNQNAVQTTEKKEDKQAGVKSPATPKPSHPTRAAKAAKAQVSENKAKQAESVTDSALKDVIAGRTTLAKAPKKEPTKKAAKKVAAPIDKRVEQQCMARIPKLVALIKASIQKTPSEFRSPYKAALLLKLSHLLEPK